MNEAGSRKSKTIPGTVSIVKPPENLPPNESPQGRKSPEELSPSQSDRIDAVNSSSIPIVPVTQLFQPRALQNTQHPDVYHRASSAGRVPVEEGLRLNSLRLTTGSLESPQSSTTRDDTISVSKIPRVVMDNNNQSVDTFDTYSMRNRNRGQSIDVDSRSGSSSEDYSDSQHEGDPSLLYRHRKGIIRARKTQNGSMVTSSLKASPSESASYGTVPLQNTVSPGSGS